MSIRAFGQPQPAFGLWPLFGGKPPEKNKPSVIPSRKPTHTQVAPARTHQRFKMPSVSDTFVYRQKGKPVQKTEVHSLIGGGQIFGKVDQLLNLAKSTVLVNLYNFQSPDLYPEKFSPPGTLGASIQGQLVDRLIELKQKRGVDVKVIIDNHWDPEFSEGHNNRTIAHLRKNGIDVVTYPNFSTISHVKLLVVDDQYAMVGGMNWGNHSPTNHDAAVMISGPDVRNIYNEIFKNDWASSGRDTREIPDMAPFPKGQIKILQTAAAKSATGPKDEIYREILNQIENAQESIYAELFVLTQAQVVDSLIDAHKRLKREGREGVKILVDPGLFFAFAACRPAVQRLAREGVPIRFFASNRDIEEKLHAKWAVFDRQRVLMGSANWSNAGLLTNYPKKTAPTDASGRLERLSKSNHEIALLIEAPKMARNFANQVMFDWNNASFPILEQRDGKWRPILPQSKKPSTSAGQGASSDTSADTPPGRRNKPASKGLPASSNPPVITPPAQKHDDQDWS